MFCTLVYTTVLVLHLLCKATSRVLIPSTVANGYDCVLQAHSYSKMYQQQSYSWEEDDFQLPYGVEKCGHEQPNCNKTYVMYHGTTRTNATAIQRNGFKQSADGMLGCGVYLSRDLQKASRYPIDPALPDSERVVFRVKVNVGNVIKINYQGHPRQNNWHKRRYGEVFDTAWCPPDCGMTKSGLEEDCVWDPSRIKIDKCITPTPLMQGPTVAEAPGSMAEAPGAMIIMGMGIILSFIFAIFGSR